jgi:steroid delta-isomerase-like uncharacterized protein
VITDDRARCPTIGSSGRRCRAAADAERQGDRTMCTAEKRCMTMRTSSEENKVLARRFGEAMNARQFHLLDELVAPDFLRHCEATPEVTVRSLEQFKEFLRQDAAVFPDSIQTPKHVIAEGDLVAVWATYAGTQKGQMGPFPPLGRKMRVDFGAVLRVEGGKIAELWVTWDNMTALAQLGHLPAPPGMNA